IIDDSGSMIATDPNRLRVAALDLLIETPGNENITFGALEFGGNLSSFGGITLENEQPAADTLFPPEAIGPNAHTMQAALNEKIKADNGLTDYNAAFAKAKTDDPGAKAWIFLTDGGHDAGEYTNGHRGGPPTYVIGFSSAITGSDGERLQQIANETGGKYFPQTDSSNLQSVVNQIGTTLTCQGVPVSFKDAFSKAGATKSHSVAIAGKARSAQLTLSWGSPLDAFTISGLHIVRKGKTVAVSSRKHKLKVVTRHGSTFLVVKLSSLVKGTLQFKVRATKIGSGAPKVSLTTQITQTS
ncbi:MAG: vWA domain-containing protein, partial [Solirubrobacteraceae bacterium]